MGRMITGVRGTHRKRLELQEFCIRDSKVDTVRRVDEVAMVALYSSSRRKLPAIEVQKHIGGLRPEKPFSQNREYTHLSSSNH